MNEQTNVPQTGPFENIGRIIDSYGAIAALFLAGIGLAFMGNILQFAIDATNGLAARTASIICAAGVVLLYGLGLYKSNQRATRVEALERENADLRADVLRMDEDHREHCSRQLMTISEDLHFRGSDRVSLYKYDDGKFVMLRRHAERPELKLPGRGIYPADQGVIGIAWNSTNGRCFVDDLPDPDDLNHYKEANLTRFNVPPGVVDGMVMRSRTIAAYVIKDHGGVGRAAVLLFESVEEGRFKDDHLYRMISGSHGRSLSLMLDVMKPREPSPKLAKQRGF